MFVPCPHCQFLVAHHPQLQPLPDACPRCGRPLQETDDAGGDDAPPPAAAPDGSAAVEADAVVPAAQDVPAIAEAASAATAVSTPGNSEPPPALQSPATSAPTRAPAPARDLARWRWPLVASLGALLVLQILLADRDRLAADPRWRPLMENVCALVRCDLQPWREPSAFSMLDRKVRPAAPGTLRVDATFRNDARWAQPWPALQLALADADGRILGSGVFAPQQYLGQAPGTSLSPGQSAQVTFLVHEPAPGTVAFSFEFR